MTSKPPDHASPWPLASLGLCVALLLVPLVLGNAGARLGAGAGLVAVVAASAVSVRRIRRVEYGDAAVQPGLVRTVAEAVGGMTGYFLATAAYLAFVFLAMVAPASGRRAEVRWLPHLLAGGAGVALVLAIVAAVRRQWRRDGVERQVFLESTCIAFFVVVLSSGVYALFEVLAGAPPLSLWSVWSLGMVTWAAVSAVRTRSTG